MADNKDEKNIEAENSQEETFTDILQEEPQPEVDSEPIPEPETPAEDTTEPQKPEKIEEAPPEPAKPEEPDVPLEEITKEVAKKTKEEVKEEILKALGISETEKEVAEEQGYKFPWEQRGEVSPKDWREVVQASMEFQDFSRVEREKALNEKQKQELALAKQREKQINDDWDAQLDYLREEGLIPEISPDIMTKIKEGKMLTTAEKNDPGLKAQVNIFETMHSIAEDLEKDGKLPIIDVVHIYNRYVKKQEPAGTSGRKAPVSGGSTPITQKEEEITYEDLHKSDFEDLLAG